ncbi:uncharacterized protein LAESUDRAFT_762647 [Laetiporus sulphureus 93-53]|uniref:Retrotransposon gag domain-containing protein n=1 Tax=Laetiporus sulphureus 93-53 TaxID=1314785 RepID=A0A165CGG0_9APHY|nr:uncharacterized protein LAESUDRAFT_762647 [Laetiporus sulphureus 93-53]KZT02764.1 hypothetical protein LAESUDRAFT_762647 [Laetiporus sulphureus 93-53]
MKFHNHTVFLDNHRQQLITQVTDLEKMVAALTAEMKELVEDYRQNIEAQVTTLDEHDVEIRMTGRKARQGGDNVADTDDDNEEPSFGRKGKGVKIDQPEKYGSNKDGVNLDDWLEQVMLWLKYTRHTKDESKIMSTLLLLKGGAHKSMQHWITEINENNKAPGTWVEFITELCTAYESIDKDKKK